MKYLLITIIRLYWLIPKGWRRKCIFKNSCSYFIYGITKEEGLKSGLKAFYSRYKQCRTNYTIYITDDKKEWVILADKTVIKRSETNI